MHTQKLTKIVATIGPASDSERVMEQLIDAGVNVFRFNTKHNTPEWHAEHIKLAQSVSDRKQVNVGILLDLQGPEIRLETSDQESIEVHKGQLLTIGSSFVGELRVVIPHVAVFKLLKPGDDLLVDDGFVETVVREVRDTELVVEIQNDSVIKHRKGVNLPGKDIDFPSLIENDIAQLDKNANAKVDFIGLSFVRSAHDIELLRSEMVKRRIKAKIVAKIESQPALDRLDEIIHSADAIMIARGDLGVEVPFEQLAYWQRLMIDKCRLAHKPVITATQMLESMIVNPRPTRAEVTDVAHAIFEGTDAIMLSGESAGGKYPVRAVETMTKIAKFNEGRRKPHQIIFESTDPTNIIADAVASVVNSKINPKIDAVLVFTETGYTARAIAKHRLNIPVIAATDERKTAEILTLSYGVYPVVTELPEGPFDSAKDVLKQLITSDVIHSGNTVVVVHGQHWQKPGNTNSLSIIAL
jgi:pyruvate kinase